VNEFEIRPYRTGDEAGILNTFNLVFREVCGEDFEDRGPEEWRWQYLDNPAGTRIHLAVAPDGTVASQFAGIPCIVDTEHGETEFVQIVDSLTHPDYRQGLNRSLFVKTCLPFVEDTTRDGVAVLYGYPVPIAERIGKRYLGYSFLRAVNYLCLDLDSVDLPAPAGVTVERVQKFPGEVDALYALVRQGLGCLTRRTGSYLTWRYLDRPGRPYEIWEARREGALVGIMVLQTNHELVADACTIADWVVPAADSETMDALVAAAARRGVQRSRRTLMAVFAEASSQHRDLLARGFAAVPSADTVERRLIYRVLNPPVTGEWLGEKWWYTLGDSDLV
jgi:hypothetical protein